MEVEELDDMARTVDFSGMFWGDRSGILWNPWMKFLEGTSEPQLPCNVLKSAIRGCGCKTLTLAGIGAQLGWTC